MVYKYLNNNCGVSIVFLRTFYEKSALESYCIFYVPGYSYYFVPLVYFYEFLSSYIIEHKYTHIVTLVIVILGRE